MVATHSLTVSARCPRDGAIDVYRVSFEVDRMIEVETLVEVCREYADKSIFQEVLTEELSTRFMARVTTVGKHGVVETTVTA